MTKEEIYDNLMFRYQFGKSIIKSNPYVNGNVYDLRLLTIRLLEEGETYDDAEKIVEIRVKRDTDTDVESLDWIIHTKCFSRDIDDLETEMMETAAFLEIYYKEMTTKFSDMTPVWKWLGD